LGSSSSSHNSVARPYANKYLGECKILDKFAGYIRSMVKDKIINLNSQTINN